MITVVIFTPITGATASGFTGRWTGATWSGRVATATIVIAALGSYFTYYDVIINNNIYTVNVAKWISVEYTEIDWSFIIDETTVTMLIPVTTVSSTVHIYATGYMSHDPHQPRFFSITAMFTGFMVVTVTGDNYTVMFVGWEFIGVASYTTISFWFTRTAAMKSGTSAFTMNKFGDTFTSVGIMIMVWAFGSTNYSTIFATSQFINTDITNLIMACFVIGATSKSAQTGTHTWTTSSMEGPTPVSATTHAACTVCAGIYTLIRSSYITEYSPTITTVCTWTGGTTTIIAGIIAITTNDIKKIIATSTMSQTGTMVVAIGTSAYNISTFHTFCHAMFKATTFMSAGSIIHSVISESQDIRTYGGFIHYTPVTYVSITIASTSTMAVPGTTGFYSKDIIIESGIGVYTISGYIIYWTSTSSATTTTTYSIRTTYTVFYNVPNASRFIYHNMHESSWFMTVPMIITSFASIFIGYTTRDIYTGFGSPFNSIFMHPNNTSIVDTETSIDTTTKTTPTIFTITGTTSVTVMYEFQYSTINVYNSSTTRAVYRFTNNKFMFDQITNNIITRSNTATGFKLNQFVDKGATQVFGPRGIYDSTNVVVYNFIRTSTGSTTHFSVYTTTGTTFVTTSYTFSTPYTTIFTMGTVTTV
uniref:NADH dehydrogenase subunit 5 n=1 Tax=Magnusiomyces suaveolens TaxID=44074 RepID=UPI001BF05024|nr:NADH dehydrogenase subunit 5 [Saprochaete suaveolens]QUV75124.1 NADH dehydrogenase subunit 5 [Saprochaete suaveolens]